MTKFPPPARRASRSPAPCSRCWPRCASTPPSGLAPVTLARQVDLARFAGTWYVIANIPTMFEGGAHNATEHYVLDADGTMDTTFSFRADASTAR